MLLDIFHVFDQPAQTADLFLPFRSFFFHFWGFSLLLLLQVLIFVEFVAFVAGWVGAHVLS